MKSFALLLLMILLVVGSGCNRANLQSSSLDNHAGNEVASKTDSTSLDRSQGKLEEQNQEFRQEDRAQTSRMGNPPAERVAKKKKYVVSIAITERERSLPASGGEDLKRVQSMLDSIESELDPKRKSAQGSSGAQGLLGRNDALRQVEDYFPGSNQNTAGKFFMKGLVSGADPRFAHAISVKELGGERFQLILEWDDSDEAVAILDELQRNAKRMVESEKLSAPRTQEEVLSIQSERSKRDDMLQPLLRQRDEIQEQYQEAFEDSFTPGDREAKVQRLTALKAQRDEISERIQSVLRGSSQKSAPKHGDDEQGPSRFVLHWTVQN